jgi:hypothetical protein
MTRLLAAASTRHLPEDALIRMVCLELSPGQRFIAKRHLGRCCECRARFVELAGVERMISQRRQNAASRLGPLSPARRDQFIHELDVLLESMPARPWWRRLPMPFGVRPFGISAPSLARAMLVICAGLIALSLWHWHPATVSAAEFLTRAVASDDRPTKIASSGVVHRRFRFKTEKKTIEHDAYRDISGRQLGNDGVDREDADLAIRLALGGVNWENPLAAVSFKNWHDRQTNPEDEVRSFGKGLLTIRTRLSSANIVQETLTVKEDGFHPIRRTIEYRDFGTVEISEISLDFLSWDRANELLLLAPQPENKPVPPRIPASSFLPTMVEMNEAELEARLILNQKSADTGEEIQVTRDSKGVQVRGLVESEERKTELKQSLRAIPFLSVTIRSFDDIKSSRAPAARNAPSQEQSAVAQVSPLERYFVEHGRSRDDLSRISSGLFNSSVAISRSCRSIEQVTLRFSAADELSPAAIRARDELLSRTVERLLNNLNDEQEFLSKADIPLESAGESSINPDRNRLDLARLADQNTALTRELVSGAGEANRSEKELASQVAETISQLRSAALAIIPGRSSK